MASEFELLGTEKAGAVIGTTTHTSLSVSVAGEHRRSEYMTFAAGSTHIMSTAAYLDRLIVIPVSTAAGVVTLSDGTTAIMSIPAASHSIDPHTYSVPLGIRNTAAAGFKIVLGANVSAIAVGGFVGAKTTA
jgi:phosphoglucomutase